MYECSYCGKEYQDASKATDCCNKPVYYDDGDWDLPRKAMRGKPSAKTHICPNVMHGGKSWQAWLEPEEKCPMCDYVWRPR